MLAKLIFVVLPLIIFSSSKNKSGEESIVPLTAKSFQDSLPPLHTIKEDDIANVESSFENQTITITLKSGKVLTYNRSQWDYENYYPSTPEKIKKEITGISMTYTKCETAPAFPGGDEAWNNYIRDFTASHKNEFDDAENGVVLLQFVVHIHGQITDISVTSNTGNSKLASLAKEAIKSSPPWTCAKQNGRDVVAYGQKKVQFNF